MNLLEDNSIEKFLENLKEHPVSPEIIQEAYAFGKAEYDKAVKDFLLDTAPDPVFSFQVFMKTAQKLKIVTAAYELIQNPCDVE